MAVLALRASAELRDLGAETDLRDHRASRAQRVRLVHPGLMVLPACRVVPVVPAQMVCPDHPASMGHRAPMGPGEQLDSQEDRVHMELRATQAPQDLQDLKDLQGLPDTADLRDQMVSKVNVVRPVPPELKDQMADPVTPAQMAIPGTQGLSVCKDSRDLPAISRDLLDMVDHPVTPDRLGNRGNKDKDTQAHKVPRARKVPQVHPAATPQLAAQTNA